MSCSINIPRKSEGRIALWCDNNLGQISFYIHNKYGGAGWRIVKERSGLSLVIEDDKLAMVFMLSCGELLE